MTSARRERVLDAPTRTEQLVAGMRFEIEIEIEIVDPSGVVAAIATADVLGRERGQRK